MRHRKTKSTNEGLGEEQNCIKQIVFDNCWAENLSELSKVGKNHHNKKFIGLTLSKRGSEKTTSEDINCDTKMRFLKNKVET